MNATGIEWTDFTSNPLKYRNADGENTWACVKTSPGCLNCYAEKMSLSTRFRPKGFVAAPFTAAAMKNVTPYMDEKELHALLTNKKISNKKVFLCDMTDLFGDWVSNAMIVELLNLLRSRRDVTFQILTKRADRMQQLLNLPFWAHPAQNVWLGVSCENREQLKRLDALEQTPAAVRFVSFEPLLEHIDVGPFLYPDGIFTPTQRTIDWAIIGGESGPGRRPIQAEWMRSIRDQCHAAGVKVFCKQLDKVQPLPPDLLACREFPLVLECVA